MQKSIILIYLVLLNFYSANDLKAQRLYKLIIYVDTYTKDGSDLEEIKSIFMDTAPTENDLSLQLYTRALKSKLIELGYEDNQASKYHLVFEVSSSKPIPQISTSTENINSTSVVKRENEKGEEEEFEVASSMSIPSYSQTLLYFHTLKLKLFDNEKNALIWQGEAVIKNNNATQQKHAAVLVSAVLDNFLNDTDDHPTRVKFTKKAQKKIRANLNKGL
jgi:hypothetical protein